MLTYDFRLPPGPRTVEYAILAEELGFRAVWCPEIPAFGHDVWVTLARIAERTSRIQFGPAVLIPSYRHPMAQASAIATVEQIAPGRLMVGFGTGFTGRAGMGKRPLSLESMRTHITQVQALLRGDVVDIDGGLAQIIASDGQLPERPIDVPIYINLAERDVSPDPHAEPGFYKACRDITLHILPRSGHCQNFAETRLEMFDRIDRWVREQAGS